MIDPCHPTAGVLRRATDAAWRAFLRSYPGWHAPAKTAAGIALSTGIMLACERSTPAAPPRSPFGSPGRFWPGEAEGGPRTIRTPDAGQAPAFDPGSATRASADMGGAGPRAAAQPLGATTLGNGQTGGAGLLEAPPFGSFSDGESRSLLLPVLPFGALYVPDLGDVVASGPTDAPRSVPTPGGLASVLAAVVAAVAWGHGRVRGVYSRKVGRVESQYRLIEGTRELTVAEIALMNEAKVLGAMIGAFVSRLRSAPDIERRWVSIGETHMQQGVMALVRAVAKPEGF